jgi:hypothetical protein
MSGLFSLINCINQDQVFCCPENFEFMQFTGLLDKNGKDIYEGDILLKYQPQTGLRMGISVVEWHNHSSRFAGISYTFDMEVIGNIYENKELL